MKKSNIISSINIVTEDDRAKCAFNCQFLIQKENAETRRYWCTLFEAIIWDRSRYMKCVEACNEWIVEKPSMIDGSAIPGDLHLCFSCDAVLTAPFPEKCPDCGKKLGVQGKGSHDNPPPVPGEKKIK